MKQQIANRLGVAHVRDTVMQFTGGSMTREQAMASLVLNKPDLSTAPQVVFTTNPRVKRS